MSEALESCEPPDGTPFKVGDHLHHLFRGTCVVIRFGNIHRMMPTVTVRFQNGEEHTLSIPCTILQPVSLTDHN